MAIEPEVQWIIYGVLMIFIVYFLPRGIVPAVESYFSNRKSVTARDTVSAASEVLKE
jgi:branched-chain amino acid transport system permease protein